MLDLEWKFAKADAVHAKLRRAVCVRTKRYLWIPADAITFIPALSPRIYGDGRALLHLTTIHSRPQFYVLRIDSRWALEDIRAPCMAPELRDFLDDIACHLEEDFGRREPDSEEDDSEILEYGNPWPAFDDRDGTAWARAKWPKLPGLKFAPHPFAWQGDLLVESAATRRRREQIAGAECDLQQTV